MVQVVKDKGCKKISFTIESCQHTKLLSIILLRLMYTNGRLNMIIVICHSE